MPQNIDFALPFQARPNPEAQLAETTHIDWVGAHGLVEDSSQLKHYAGERLAEMCGYVCPDARGEDLRAALDGMGWMGLLDHVFPGFLSHEPDRAAHIVTQCMAVTDTDTGRVRSADPWVRSFQDVWLRVCEGTSRPWQRRLSERLREWFRDSRLEVLQRTSGVPISTPAYWHLRRSVYNNGWIAFMGERGERFEPPEAYWLSAHREALSQAIDEVGIFINDTHSVDVEERDGSPHNILLIREREQRCSRAEAIAGLVADAEAACDRFLQLEAQLPALCTELGLSADERRDAEHCVAVRRNLAASTLEWGRRSGRYGGAAPEARQDHHAHRAPS